MYVCMYVGIRTYVYMYCMHVCMHHGGFVAGLENGVLDVGVHDIQHFRLGGHKAETCMYVCMYVCKNVNVCMYVMQYL